MSSWRLLRGTCTVLQLPPRRQARTCLQQRGVLGRAASSSAAPDATPTSDSSPSPSSASSQQRLLNSSSWIKNPHLQPFIFSHTDRPPDAKQGGPFGIHFLGTGAGTPSLQRSSSATALTLGGNTYLFDAGEGVQRQVMQSPRVRPGRITKIFITHLHGDHIFGLPGLLLNLQSVAKLTSAQSPRKAATRVIEVYGPVGLYNYIATSISLSCTELKYVQVHVFELTGGSRRWVHPGSLGDYAEFRHRGLRRHCIPQNKDGTWTLETPIELNTPEDAEKYSSSPSGVYVKAAQIMHIPRLQCFGYVVEEPHSQPRKIDVQRAQAAGVAPGRAFKLLKSGFAVPSDDGSRMVQPEEVWVLDETPPKARKLAILGDCTAVPRPMIELCQGADVLVHEATFLESQKGANVDFGGHSTASMAAMVANQVNAKVLALNHVSATHQNAVSEAQLVAEAESIIQNASQTQVQLTYDLMDLFVPRNGFPTEWE